MWTEEMNPAKEGLFARAQALQEFDGRGRGARIVIAKRRRERVRLVVLGEALRHVARLEDVGRPSIVGDGRAVHASPAEPAREWAGGIVKRHAESHADVLA